MLLSRVVVLAMFTLFCVEVYGQLSYDFYENSCPQVEDIVRASLHTISSIDPTSPAALLRLMFHDCQVQGCDGSILIEESGTNTPLEITSSKNYGIRKREAISMIKYMVEEECPQQVSCADILILAARDAVVLSGGPHIKVPLGRRDSYSSPSYKVADSSLPSPNIGVGGMLRVFASKGMNIEESVAIMGAHTIGVTHCFNILSRLYKPNQKDKMANRMEPGFALLLRLTCPQQSLTTNITFVVNDATSFLFDNHYYKHSMVGRGVLRIDADMSSDARTARIVSRFANNEDAFFRAFSSAFVKLSSYRVLTGSDGVVREYCKIF